MNKEAKVQNEVRPDSRKTSVSLGNRIINKLGIYVVVILMLAVGVVISPRQYLSIANLRSILSAVSLTGICSVGLAFVVYSANFNNMSIPMTIALSGMVSVQLIPCGVVVSLVGGVVVGSLVGIVNGLIIGKFRANPVIWTLSFNLVLSGIVRVAWGGAQVYPDTMADLAGSQIARQAADVFNSLARTYFFGDNLPLMVVVMAVMFVVAQLVLTRTKFGNQLKIVGSNYEVARLSGINCVKLVIIAYVISAFCASVCGLFYTSLTKTGAYTNGEGYDFSCLTGVLLGGMTLAGGKGDMVGVFGGVLAVGMLMNILTLLGVPTFDQWLVQGLVFLFIVWLSTNSARKLGRA